MLPDMRITDQKKKKNRTSIKERKKEKRKEKRIPIFFNPNFMGVLLYPLWVSYFIPLLTKGKRQKKKEKKKDTHFLNRDIYGHPFFLLGCPFFSFLFSPFLLPFFLYWFMDVLFFYPIFFFIFFLFSFFYFFLLFFLRTDKRTEISKTLVLQMVIVLQQRMFKKWASSGPLDDPQWAWQPSRIWSLGMVAWQIIRSLPDRLLCFDISKVQLFMRGTINEHGESQTAIR